MDVKRLGMLISLGIALPSRAMADEPAKKTISLSSRPHTIAEVEAGVVVLPTAPISPAQRGGSTPIFGTIGKGDATLQTGLHVLYRTGPEWVIGAAASFAPSPTTDTEYGGGSALPRSHARSYFLLVLEGRYIPVRTDTFDVWVGLRGGGIIVADRFSTETGENVPTVFGTSAVTVRTEGAVLGIQAGTNWYFAERWALGLGLRGDRWLLPVTPACSPIGDCATLSGAIEAFSAGLTISYRIPL